MNIQEALQSLNPEDDKLWTENGSPRMDVLQALTKNDTLTRKMATDAAPSFTRETHTAALAEPETAAGEPNTDATLDPSADPVVDPTDLRSVEEQFSDDEAAALGDPASEESSPDVGDDSAELSEPPRVPLTTTDVLATLPATPGQTVNPIPDLEELKATRDELGEMMLEAQRDQVDAKTLADTLANQVNHYNRVIDEAEKRADPQHATAGIRAYINQQNKSRAARARGLQRFTEETGVDPKDVARVTNPKAPIDQAFSLRKTPRGMQRPTR